MWNLECKLYFVIFSESEALRYFLTNFPGSNPLARRSRLNKMDDNVNKGESDLKEMSGRANGAVYDCVTMEELSGAEDGESKTEAKKYYEEETVYANSQGTVPAN